MEPINLSKEAPIQQPDDMILAAFRDVGQNLAEARREQNLTIKQVAAKIHIRQQYLSDLEEGRISDLPGRVYILGFIRTYARFLNLDGEELIRRIRKLPNLQHYKRSDAPVPLQPEEGPSLPVLIVSSALVGCMAMGGYFFLRPPSTPLEGPVLETPKAQQDEGAAPTPSPQGPEAPDEAMPAPIAAPPIATEEEAQPSPPSKKFTLKAREPSWVEVRDGDGKVIFMKVLNEGEEYVAPEKPGITISTGNAGGFDIFLGDAKLPPLGGHGDVKRDIRLEALP